QGALKPPKHGHQYSRAKRIGEQDHQGRERELEGDRIAMDTLHVPGLLRGASVASDVLAGPLMQFTRELDADDLPEGEFRRDEQRAALARSQIDEGEALVVDVERPQYLEEELRVARVVEDAVTGIVSVDRQSVEGDDAARPDFVTPIEHLAAGLTHDRSQTVDQRRDE